MDRPQEADADGKQERGEKPSSSAYLRPPGQVSSGMLTTTLGRVIVISPAASAAFNQAETQPFSADPAEAAAPPAENPPLQVRLLPEVTGAVQAPWGTPRLHKDISGNLSRAV